MTYPPCILIHNPLVFKLAFHEEQIYKCLFGNITGKLTMVTNLRTYTKVSSIVNPFQTGTVSVLFIYGSLIQDLSGVARSEFNVSLMTYNKGLLVLTDSTSRFFAYNR